MRLALILVWMPLLALGQEPKKALLTIPADRSADTYAIYSAVLAQPRLSRFEEDKKYLVLELSGEKMEIEPGSCMDVPAGYRPAFAELQADRSQHHEEHFPLERAFNSPKPYDLLTEAQANRFMASRMGRNLTTDDVDLFRGAVHLITLGNVYFDRKRTMAAVYTSAWCGGLCGFWTWRVFLKNGKGGWDEQHWTNCFTVAALRFRPRESLRRFVGQVGNLRIGNPPARTGRAAAVQGRRACTV